MSILLVIILSTFIAVFFAGKAMLGVVEALDEFDNALEKLNRSLDEKIQDIR